MQLFKGDLLFVLLPFVLRKLGCASAAEVTMADRSGEWGIEKGDCESNNHPHEKSFSAFQNKSNNRAVAMATTALFKDETWDLCLINTSPSLLFLAPHLSLSDGGRPELSRSKRWSNGCSLKAPLYPGNHSLYMATSITAATSITSHMSCCPLFVGVVWVWVCVQDSLMEGPSISRQVVLMVTPNKAILTAVLALIEGAESQSYKK